MSFFLHVAPSLSAGPLGAALREGEAPSFAHPREHPADKLVKGYPLESFALWAEFVREQVLRPVPYLPLNPIPTSVDGEHITSCGESTDGERTPEAAAGGVAGSLMSDRSARPPKLDLLELLVGRKIGHRPLVRDGVLVDHVAAIGRLVAEREVRLSREEHFRVGIQRPLDDAFP